VSNTMWFEREERRRMVEKYAWFEY